MTALVLALLAGPAVAGGPPEGLLEVATGRFVLTEQAPGVRRRLDTAVEHAIASLNFAIRPLARYRLRPAVYETVCSDLFLRLTRDAFTVQCAARDAETRHFDGRDAHFEEDGEPYEVTFAFEGDGVQVTTSGPRGGQSNCYTFDGAGGMDLRGSIFSTSLPQPLRWILPYKRVFTP